MAVLAAWMMVTGRAPAGTLDPTNAPAPTMHTLEEIYQKVDAYVTPRTLSATTTAVQTGYYAATNLALVDRDLKENNIKKDVFIFGMDGTHESGDNTYTNSKAARWKTGQTVSYVSGDDAYHKMGYSWPNPRFTVGSGTASNCMTDNLTGLMWLKNPDFIFRTWPEALVYCEALDGNNSRGNYTDWRLPNVFELQSLIDYGSYGPALPADNPIGAAGIRSDYYWTSTTFSPLIETSPGVFERYSYFVDMGSGGIGLNPQSRGTYVWPVRGGS